MAARGSPVRDLCEEATCPICLDYFKDPVTIAECGHNYCRACLAQCWGELAAEAPCPQCRAQGQRRALIPNRQLANVVELTKKLSLGSGERVCQKHQEPLKLFCKKDKRPICVVCDRAKEHRKHNVVPVEAAAQECRKEINDLLLWVRHQEELLEENKARTENVIEDLLMHIKMEREKTVTEFRQLHQFLEEQEKLLLAQMGEVEKEIVSRSEEYLARVSKELCTLGSYIDDIWWTRQKPASEFLQDIQSIIEKYQVELNLQDLPTSQYFCDIKWRTWEFCDINSFLEGVMKQFKDMLVSGRQLQKANVTLDPDTAHPQFILSEDHKSVRMGPERQDLPQNPKRFEHYFFVLGHEEFTNGRYFWEVTVERSNEWALGVAKKSVKRKGEFECAPVEGFWTVGNRNGEHIIPDFIYGIGTIRTIRVSLNCPGERVAFYNAETADLLFVISGASFSGEAIHPFFSLGERDSCLALQ